MPQPEQRQPTEGIFRIREYVPGDDMRRIHWVRSLQVNELVVRLPDEMPAPSANVRLILDNALWGAGFLTCQAPDQLLDAAVRVWLGIAKSLTDTGTRVTLVTTADLGKGHAVLERVMHPRSSREAMRIGARVTWQCALSLEALIKRRPVKQVVVTCRPRALADAPDAVWVAVPEFGVDHRPSRDTDAVADQAQRFRSAPPTTAGRIGTASSAADRAMGQDRSLFSQVTCWTHVAGWSGYLVAHPVDGSVELPVIP